MRKLLLAIFILLLIPGGLLIWLATSQSGLQWAYQQAQPYIPATITIKQIEGRLIGPISLSGIHYSDQSIDIISESAIIDWAPLSLLGATVNINQLHVNTTRILLKQSESTTNDSKLAPPTLPLRFTLSNVHIKGITIEQPENRQTINSISLAATTGYQHVRIKKLNIQRDNADLSIHGLIKLDEVFNHNLNVKWKFDLNDDLTLNGHGNISGNINNVIIQQELDKPQRIKTRTSISQPLQELNWETSVTAGNISAFAFNPEWPDIPVNVNLKANGNLDKAHIAVDLNDSGSSKTLTTGKLNIQGDIKLHDELVNLKIESSHVSTQNLQSHWLLDADILPTSASIKSLDIAALKGNTRISGDINWAENIHWKAVIKSSGIDPGVLLDQLPGRLNTSFSINGQLVDGNVRSSFDNIRVEGELNTQPVKLDGRLRIDNNRLFIDKMNLLSAKTVLNLKGSVNQDVSLNWNINSDNLSQLYPPLKGKLIANGSVHGTRYKPSIEARIDAKNLAYDIYASEDLNASVTLDLGDYRKNTLNLSASKILLNQQLIDTLSVNLTSNSLRTELKSDKINSLLEFKGEIKPDIIKGDIVTASLNTSDYGSWTLDNTSSLTIDRTNADDIAIQFDKTCWKNIDHSTACIQLQQTENKWTGTLQANNLDLKLLDTNLPVDLQLRGKAQLTTRFDLTENRSVNASVLLQLNKGSIQQVISKRQTNEWLYNNGHIKLDIDNKGLQASSRIDIQNDDLFTASLTMPGFNPFTYQSDTQAVNADIELRMSDPGIIEATIPEPVDLEGKMLLKLRMTGYTANPQVTGSINIDNGRLHIPRLGLNIENIQLESQNRPDNTIHYKLTAQSGDGNIKISGFNKIDIEQGFPGEIHIKGSDFEVSSIPEARVNASPDLTIKVNKRTINIDGSIHIPYAKLQPKDISSAENVSSDVVIVGEENTENKPWIITSKIRLSLGDRVSFYGFGFEGRFGGEVLLQDQPGQPTIATGTLTIPEGRYRAYGQRLDVEYGKLIYTGSPVNNPGLDIRAVRKINEVTAGLTIRGNLSKPRIELFSSPAMGQSDILAYLILGGPIENASGEEGATMARAALALGLTGGDQLARRIGDRFGFDEMRVETSDNGDQASLVVGRYLSPKLYVSYGVGLVEALNSVRLRYQISSKWQLKVESGEAHGADFLYTIER